MDSHGLMRVNNKFNNQYDDFPGGGGALPGLAPGLLGQVFVVTKEHALQLSDPTVGTLFEGEYQLVKLGTTPTVDAALVIPNRGFLLFWSNRANFEVNTDDELRSELAGVFLNNIKLNSVGAPIDPAGKYVWMQKVTPKSHGRATVKAPTVAVFAADTPVIAAGDGTALAAAGVIEDPITPFTVGMAEDDNDGVTGLLTVRLGA